MYIIHIDVLEGRYLPFARQIRPVVKCLPQLSSVGVLSLGFFNVVELGDFSHVKRSLVLLDAVSLFQDLITYIVEFLHVKEDVVNVIGHIQVPWLLDFLQEGSSLGV